VTLKDKVVQMLYSDRNMLISVGDSNGQSVVFEHICFLSFHFRILLICHNCVT